MKTTFLRLQSSLVWFGLLIGVMMPCVQTHAMTVTIYNAWWSNQTDSGGGCMVPTSGSAFRLNWDPDVVGCVGTTSVFEKVYFKLTSSSTWTLWTTTPVHTITACVTTDQQYVDIPASSCCTPYDYKIELYRYERGQEFPTPDYTRDPSNDSDLSGHKEGLACVALAGPPTIVQHPQSLVVTQGGTAVFSLVASGCPPLGYQWLIDGSPIFGATDSSYSTPGVPWNGGNYSVVVSDAGGAVTSSIAMLAVLPPTTATGPAGNVAACPGTSVTLATTPAGAGPFTFQWYFNQIPLPFATNSALALGPLSAASNGSYCVVVTGWCNSVTNCTTLSVGAAGDAPVITGQPQPQRVACGGTAAIAVTASGTPPLQYQWLAHGTNLPGATRAALVLSNVAPADAGTYEVQVSNSVWHTLSEAAWLAVDEPRPGPLRIVLQQTNLQIAWSRSCASYLLEQTPQLGPSNVWAPVTVPPPVTDQDYVVPVPLETYNRFYRLRKDLQLRLTPQAPSGPLRLAPGTQTNITVAVERSYPDTAIGLQVLALLAPAFTLPSSNAQAFVASGVPGIQGAATLQPFQYTVQVPVSLGQNVTNGAYKVHLTYTDGSLARLAPNASWDLWVECPQCPPEPPTLDDLRSDDNSVTLYWTEHCTGPVGYRLFRDGALIATFAATPGVREVTHAYTDILPAIRPKTPGSYQYEMDIFTITQLDPPYTIPPFPPYNPFEIAGPIFTIGAPPEPDTAQIVSYGCDPSLGPCGQKVCGGCGLSSCLGIDYTGIQIHFRYTKVCSLGGYRVYRKGLTPTGGSPNSFILIAERPFICDYLMPGCNYATRVTNPQWYVDSPIYKETHYEYKLEIYNQWGACSVPLSITSDATPAPARNFKANYVLQAAIGLQWEYGPAIAGPSPCLATSCELRRMEWNPGSPVDPNDPNSYQIIATRPYSASPVTYRDDTVQPYHSYRYLVRALYKGLFFRPDVFSPSDCGWYQAYSQPAPPPSCTYSLSASSASYPATGGSGSVSITTASGCTWTITGVPWWIRGLPAGSTGPAKLSYTVAANTAYSTSTATLTIAGKPYIVTQAGAAPASVPAYLTGVGNGTDPFQPSPNESFTAYFTIFNGGDTASADFKCQFDLDDEYGSVLDTWYQDMSSIGGHAGYQVPLTFNSGLPEGLYKLMLHIDCDHDVQPQPYDVPPLTISVY